MSLQIQIADVGIIVLEPEDLRLLQKGSPQKIHLDKFTNGGRDLRVLCLDFAPDAEWLAGAIAQHLQSGGEPRGIVGLISEASKRPEPPLRPKHEPLAFLQPGQKSGKA